MALAIIVSSATSPRHPA